MVDLLQGVFEEALPDRVAAQGSCGNALATFHYPEFVASYERRGSRPAIARAVATHSPAKMAMRRGTAISSPMEVFLT